MSYDFNASEILEVAIQIEDNGARFYRKASEMQTDSPNKAFLDKLAIMEDGHKRIFIEMKKNVTDAEKTSTVFDPNNESPLYLSAMADSHGGEGSPKAADALTGRETMKEILKTAMELEKESILFYLGLRDYVPPKFGQAKLDEIINEEKSHVIQLDGLLKKLRK